MDQPVGVHAGIVAATGCFSVTTDTGFVGTWQRLDEPTSTIAIRRSATGHVFAWRLDKGDRRVDDEGEGRCTEYLDGAKVSEYVFRVEAEEGSSHLLLRIEATAFGPEGEDLTATDRLEVRPGGLELWAYTITSNGETLETPIGPYKYSKVSDEPF